MTVVGRVPILVVDILAVALSDQSCFHHLPAGSITLGTPLDLFGFGAVSLLRGSPGLSIFLRVRTDSHLLPHTSYTYYTIFTRQSQAKSYKEVNFLRTGALSTAPLLRSSRSNTS